MHGRGAAILLRDCFARVAALRLRREVEELVVVALERALPGPGAALLEAGREAGLQERDLIARAAAAFLNFATFNLSDDLSDGECTYLPPPAAAALVLVLDNLFFTALRELALPDAVEQRVLADLRAAEEAQILEVCTTAWTAERLTVVTDGIAGRQWAAYLTLLWAGTPLEPQAAELSRHLGRVALLADDLRRADPRATSLSSEDRELVVARALASAKALEASGHAFVRATLRHSLPVLAAAGR